MWRREPFAPLMVETSHISPCYPYRGLREGESEEEYGLRVANELEEKIIELGPDQVMAFIAEPVVGATLGAVPGVAGYFRRIREICDSYGVLLILDEVMCGMGRTGTLYACEQDEIAPDIMAIAKGLGGGYQPIGAMLCSNEIYRTIEEGSGFFQHGHTYMGHPVACAAGLAVVSALIERKLVQRCRDMGNRLDQALRDRFESHPHVGDIRGRGLFMGVELVQDKYSKEPFDPFLGVNKKVKKAAFEAGLICYPMGGTIDGHRGDHVLLAPPFIIEEQQVDELVEKLSLAIDSATSS
jgi:adenosylmethionine-8-amino-7-oxononanoate aminotransferase